MMLQKQRVVSIPCHNIFDRECVVSRWGQKPDWLTLNALPPRLTGRYAHQLTFPSHVGSHCRQI